MNNPTPSWIEISVCTNAEISNWLEAAFSDNGALAITFQDSEDEQPIFEPAIGETPLWTSTRLTALYQMPLDIDQTLSSVQQDFDQLCDHQHPFPQWYIKEFKDKDWERAWLDSFKPLQFGDQFWVVPSWLKPPEPSAPFMKIDPGLAFGTGSHETTSLCLTWLANHQAALTKENLHLIDYGCGSGILAVASTKLGASNVTAIDIDPQAVIATRQNRDLNAISEAQLTTLLATTTKETPNGTEQTEKLIKQADIIVANILCGPLIQLASYFISMLKTNGSIVLSGILAEQVNQITDVYDKWIIFSPVKINNGWALLSGYKKADVE